MALSFVFVLTAPAEKVGNSNDDNGCTPTTTITPSASFAGYTTHAPLRLNTKYYTADIPIWVDEIPLQSSHQGSGEEIHSTLDPSTWKSEFLGPEAREVRDAVGAVVVCICPPERVGGAVPTGDAGGEKGRRDAEVLGMRLKEAVGAVAEVKSRIDEERGGIGDVVGLVVVVESGKWKTQKQANEGDGRIVVEEFGTSWWDEELNDMGIFDFEVVSWHPAEEEGDKEVQVRRNGFGGMLSLG